MTLKQYLFEFGIKKSDFAGKIGVAPSHVSGLLSGKRPSLDLAVIIEKESDGHVTLYDWICGEGDALCK